MRIFFVVLIASSFLVTATGCLMRKVIREGSRVTFDYTLAVEGRVVDSAEISGPMTYIQGKGQIIPGLDRQLEGLRVGEKKTIVVTPEEGYGEIEPHAFREVKRSLLPPAIEPKAGMILDMEDPDGHIFPVTITEVKKDTVILNFNHPLAGKTLNLEVKILSVQ